MKIKSIHVRRFRSIENAALVDCGGLNVLIGKNNAGKSNFLATIELMQLHLKGGVIAGSWPSTRPQDDFTNRASAIPLQIGLEYGLDSSINTKLRDQLKMEAPHLEQSIDQIKSYETIAFVLAGSLQGSKAFVYIEQIAVGNIILESDPLAINGIPLLSVPTSVGQELFELQKEATSLRLDLRALESIDSDRLAPYLGRDLPPSYIVDSSIGNRGSFRLRQNLQKQLSSADTIEQANTAIRQLISETRSRIEEQRQKETSEAMSAFAGKAKIPPDYAGWLMKQYGAMPALHFKETKDPIGRDEAAALLGLKIRRGGSERFAAIQQVVRSLLGVSVDAFESEDSGSDRTAEMDVDEFLAEANGAGVREALRLILDLELKNPQLVLIEEPEVHLHPGLEHAIYSYLRQKSRHIQMFVTTHSTNFVDSISFQNIYLVSRDSQRRTHCEAVDSGEGVLRIPSELGLRLSTVFMFDRLVFVEGPSDEAVLREFAQRLNLDLAKANVEFVQMGGVRNFAHFAAEGTLDLLSRRRITMRFITDRDEREDEEVKRMMARLGERARLVVLERRELENYLLDPEAVTAFVIEKQIAADSPKAPPSTDDVAKTIAQQAESLEAEVIRLRVEKAVLRSIHLQVHGVETSAEDKIQGAIAELNQRLNAIDAERLRISTDVKNVWPREALKLAPGSLILEKTVRQFGVRYNKQAGDSARLARSVSEANIDEELSYLLREISQTDGN